VSRLLVAAFSGGVAAMLGACGAPYSARGTAPVPAAWVVRISGFQFRPSEFSVVAGDTVIWANDDALRHTATADGGAWSTPELDRGQQVSWVPRTPGRYPYHCAAHPTMHGVLLVAPRAGGT
jgi:plastocyanin